MVILAALIVAWGLSNEVTMTPDELVEQADALIANSRPTSYDYFVLYADQGHLGICRVEHFPSNGWPIKCLNSNDINNGLNSAERCRICEAITWLYKAELLV